jgi:hypothetical protein
MPRYQWVGLDTPVTWSTASTCNIQWHPSTWNTATATTTITYTNTATTWANANWLVYDEVANIDLGLLTPPAILSAKTRRRLRREQREWEERMRVEREAAEVLASMAKRKARALLYSALSRDQQRSLEERQYFELNIGGKTYRIKQGTHGNVRLVQGDVETMLYCAQPNGVPAEDAMLAQKLMLECDEQAFLRVANARVLARAA